MFTSTMTDSGAGGGRGNDLPLVLVTVGDDDGELAFTSWMFILPAANSGQASLGMTPEPIAIEGWQLEATLDSLRSNTIPASLDITFGPDLNAILQSLGDTSNVLTFNSYAKLWDIVPNTP